ncbi:MAG: HAD family hydrolase, partial [Bacteroidales bacterium]|nr:HAD family hydrolase [Bacteroidales bacterium]
MKQPITTLLFDFDGTLADTTRTILKAMSLTIAELGLPLPPETQMKSGIGLP